MKKALSYLLLATYTLMLLKPVLPYVSDCLAHAFWKYEHIATVHKENGKTHIHYELSQAAKETGDEKGNSNTGIEVSVTPHVMNNLSFDFTIARLLNNHYPAPISRLTSTSLAGAYPPPKG